MQHHVLSSPSQHSEARELMPGSGDPQKAPELGVYKISFGARYKYQFFMDGTQTLLACDL